MTLYINYPLIICILGLILYAIGAEATKTAKVQHIGMAMFETGLVATLLIWGLKHV